MFRGVETGAGVLSSLSLLAMAVYVSATPVLVALTYPASVRSMMVIVPDIPLWHRSPGTAALVLALGLAGSMAISLIAYADGRHQRVVTLAGLWSLAIALLAVVLITPLRFIVFSQIPALLALFTASVATLSRRSISL